MCSVHEDLGRFTRLMYAPTGHRIYGGAFYGRCVAPISRFVVYAMDKVHGERMCAHAGNPTVVRRVRAIKLPRAGDSQDRWMAAPMSYMQSVQR